jgi:hypothetical protein
LQRSWSPRSAASSASLSLSSAVIEFPPLAHPQQERALGGSPFGTNIAAREQMASACRVHVACRFW